MRKGVPLTWQQDQQGAFGLLKNCVIIAPIPVYPDHNEELLVHVDTFPLQVARQHRKMRRGLTTPLYSGWGCFASRPISETGENYNATERGAPCIDGGMVYSVPPSLLVGRHSRVSCRSPLNNSRGFFLISKPVIHGRVSRWLIFLQEFTLRALSI